MIDILALRTELNISQKDFAQSLGITQGSVSHWELRKRPFPKDGIDKLINVYGEEIVLKHDTLTEKDINPDYVKKGGLFRKPSGLKKVVFEDESLRASIEELKEKIQQQEEEIDNLHRLVVGLMTKDKPHMA